MALTTAQKAVLAELQEAGVTGKYLERQVVARKLTSEDIAWNRRLGRPLAFKETVHPSVETARRRAWTAANPAPAPAPEA